MLFKKMIFTVLLLGLVLFVYAENISLEDAISSALSNNPDIKTQAISLATAKREKDNTWNNWLPSISLGGSASNAHPDGDWSWSGSAGVTLALNASIPAKMKQTALAYEIALTNYKQLENTVFSNVSSSFYSLIAAQQNIKILESSLTLAESTYKQIQQNYNRGLASELDMLNAQYSYQSITPSIESAKSAYTYDLVAFAVLIGKSPEDISISTDMDIPVKELKLPETSNLISSYKDQRYDVILKQYAVTNAELAYKIQNTQGKVPSLSLSESFSVADRGTGLTQGGTFTASVSIPLASYIPGSSTNLAVKETQDAITSAKLNLENTKLNAENDITKKASEVLRLWKSISLSELNVNIAKRSYELSNEGYLSGLVSRTDADTARQKMITAQQSVLQAKIDYFSAVNNLANALQLTVDELYALMGEK